MENTLFAGLYALEPGESLSTAGYAFQSVNPLITDHFLQVGAKTHRHNGAAPLDPPSDQASAAVTASGGTIPGGGTMFFTYTWVDEQNGETLPASAVTLALPNGIPSPVSGPSGAVDYSGGGLLTNTYYYTKTWYDANGNETLPGPYARFIREPGFPSGQVNFTDLDVGMPSGAVGWRLYKSTAGGHYHFIASGATGDSTLTDDGSLCGDCVTQPPTVNRTGGNNSVTLALPSGAAIPAGVTGLRVYGSLSGAFVNPSLIAAIPSAAASAGVVLNSFAPALGSPPIIPTAVGGADKIDPDTDILDWHWKRPVGSASELASGEAGDVRFVQESHRLYTPSGSAAVASGDWMQVPGTVAVSGSAGVVVPSAAALYFPSGTVTASGASAIINVGGGGGGGGGGGAAPEAWTAITFNPSFPRFQSIHTSSTGYVQSIGAVPPAAGFYKDPNSVVHMRGGIEIYGLGGGTQLDWQVPGINQPMFTLPAGYRPDTDFIYPVDYFRASDSTWWRAFLLIKTDGKGYMGSLLPPDIAGYPSGMYDGDQILIQGADFRAA